jgi:ClpP class serine protease
MSKLEESIRKRDSAKKKFYDEVKGFMLVLKASPEVSYLDEAFEEVKIKYKAIRKIHDQITDLLTLKEGQVIDGELAKHDGFIEEIMTEFSVLLGKLEEYQKSQKEPAVSPPGERTQAKIKFGKDQSSTICGRYKELSYMEKVIQ